MGVPAWIRRVARAEAAATGDPVLDRRDRDPWRRLDVRRLPEGGPPYLAGGLHRRHDCRVQVPAPAAPPLGVRLEPVARSVAEPLARQLAEPLAPVPVEGLVRPSSRQRGLESSVRPGG